MFLSRCSNLFPFSVAVLASDWKLFTKAHFKSQDSVLLFSEDRWEVFWGNSEIINTDFQPHKPHFSYSLPSLRASTGGKTIKTNGWDSTKLAPWCTVQTQCKGCTGVCAQKDGEDKKKRNSKVIELQITVWRSTEEIPWFKRFVDSV